MKWRDISSNEKCPQWKPRSSQHNEEYPAQKLPAQTTWPVFTHQNQVHCIFQNLKTNSLKAHILQDMILLVVRFLVLSLKLPSMHPYELTRSSNNCIKINEKIRQKKIKNSAFLKKFSKSWRTDPDPESRIQIRIKIIWILITGKLTNSYLIYRLPWKPILLVICGYSQLTTSLSETFLKLTWWYMICHLSKLTYPISDK